MRTIWVFIVLAIILVTSVLSIPAMGDDGYHAIVIGNVSKDILENLTLKGVSNIMYCGEVPECLNCQKILNESDIVLVIKDGIPVLVVHDNSTIRDINITSLSESASVIPSIKGNVTEYVSKIKYQGFILCLQRARCHAGDSSFYIKSLVYILIGTLVLGAVVYYYNKKEERE